MHLLLGTPVNKGKKKGRGRYDAAFYTLLDRCLPQPASLKPPLHNLTSITPENAT
jgi:hypothetical protein